MFQVPGAFINDPEGMVNNIGIDRTVVMVSIVDEEDASQGNVEYRFFLSGL